MTSDSVLPSSSLHASCTSTPPMTIGGMENPSFGQGQPASALAPAWAESGFDCALLHAQELSWWAKPTWTNLPRAWWALGPHTAHLQAPLMPGGPHFA